MPSDTSRRSPAKSLPTDRFINRELSWLDFNSRVLDQAADSSVALLERAKFLAITSSNLDEFVMVRIGSLKMQQVENATLLDPSGMTCAEQLEAVSARCHEMVSRQYELFRDRLEPELREHRIDGIDLDQCDQVVYEAAESRFRNDVLAVLSPQAIVPQRPFPLLPGLGIHVCVRLKPLETPGPDDALWDFAVIPMGRILPRIMPLPRERGHAYVLIDDLVRHHINSFFPGRDVAECISFRITRNADVEMREDGAADLMVGMEEVLESRRQSRCIRLEYTAGASDVMVSFLSERLEVRAQDLYAIDGPLDLTYLFGLHGVEGYEKLRDEAWPPQRNPSIDPTESMFDRMTQGDLLLVHPYEQFDPVVRLIEEAAVDPDVLSIKQVLYRTSRNSPIVAALMRAAEHGKYVSAIVELKARFDEARNIEWAREMERVGVQVIYGIRGLKTHAKVCIIVRRQAEGIVRYMHFGTGNYNEVTANLYSDVSLLTCNEELGTDATLFFNCVTGASEPQDMQHLSAAPLSLRERLLDLIDGETRRHQQSQQGKITAKLNALVDTEIIDALYRASQAGVAIKLNVRGVCCLKPGVKGLSETIQVVSIVDRFLEHARVFHFGHGGDDVVFISSADWMPRNLNRRVELMIPVEDPACRRKLYATLQTYFRDNTNTWMMDSGGRYHRNKSAEEPFRAQQVLYQRALQKNQAIQQDRLTRFETHQQKSSG